MRAEVPRGLGSSKLDSSHHCGQLEPEYRRDVRGERSVFYIPWDARSFWVYHLSCIGDSWVLLFVLLVRHRVALVFFYVASPSKLGSGFIVAMQLLGATFGCCHNADHCCRAVELDWSGLILTSKTNNSCPQFTPNLNRFISRRAT